MRPRRESSTSNPCLVCCHSIDNVKRFQTVGPCNHVGCCSLCVLRMRQILKNKHCSLCKTEMERVICIDDETRTFESYQDWGDNIGPTHVYDEQSGMYFVKSNYNDIVAMRSFMCPVAKCSEKKPFGNYGALKNHLNAKHGQSFCDICVNNNNLFIQEQTLFTKEGLKKHTNKGNQEQGFMGHPKCDFCGSRYYSNQELYEHLRKNHFECEICLHGHGIENRYYKDYNDLENHFRAEHFLCEEASCLAKKFIVFKDHIQFQMHMSAEHPHIRTSKRIDVNFSVRRGDREGRDAYTGYGFREDELLAAGMTASEPSITVADFPALSASDTAYNLTFWQHQNQIRAPSVDDFPELAPSAPVAAPAPAYRNAIAPQPTAAMRAHMSNDPWEYPELQHAANTLGANNPLMRFVKPKKNKKKKSQLLSERLDDEEEEKPAPPPVTEAAPEAAPPPAAPEESVIESIQEALGNEARFIQFREVCKKYRQKEIPALSFYSLSRAMFKPEDFTRLFPKLMSLLPDEKQVEEVMALHKGKKTNKKKAKAASPKSPKEEESSPSPIASPTPQAPSPPPQAARATPSAADILARQPAATRAPIAFGEESWPAPQPVAAPAPHVAKKSKKPTAANSGWSNVLKEVGAAAVPKSTNGPKMNLVVNNTDGFNARSRHAQSQPETNSWSSSANWSEPVSAPTIAVGATPISTKIQVVAKEDVYGMENLDINRALQPNKVPSRNKNDFPDLPKAGPAIGVQPVLLNKNQTTTHGNWGEKVNTNPAPQKPKKNKKKTMSLAELGMKFG